MKYTNGSTRSAQDSFAFILRDSEPQQGRNRDAFVFVYDTEGKPLSVDSLETPSRGSHLFRMEGAGVAIAGYYYYDTEFDNTLGLNFYTPYKVDAKWTTLVSGADIAPSRMTAAYTSVGDGYSATSHSSYLGVRTNVASLNVSNPAKAQRYSNTNRPSYVMRFDAPPVSFSGNLWGSELRVSATVNGQNYPAAVFVAPNWSGTETVSVSE